MKFEDKSIIIDKFIELAKKSKLNCEQKKKNSTYNRKFK